MKEHIDLPTLPLTDAEKFHLQTIYGTRLRNLGFVYVCLVMAALYASLAGFSKPKVRYRAYDYEIAGVSLTREQTGLIIAGLLQAVVVGSCGRMFFKRVRPFKKDVELGMKEIVSYTIVQKRYFEHTCQCFFSLNDPNYMHHEVDADTFSSLSEGDTVQIYRAVYSKYVFHKDGKFEFI